MLLTFLSTSLCLTKVSKDFLLTYFRFKNNQFNLELYQSLDIDKEEKAIRKQFNLSHEDITYRDFQDLSREQLKVLLNYLIDHITIKEIEIFDNRKVILAVTIHLKLNGYAPKQTLEYLKNIRYKDSENTNGKPFKNDLPLVGGEGGIRTLAPVSRPTPLAGAPLRPA